LDDVRRRWDVLDGADRREEGVVDEEDEDQEERDEIGEAGAGKGDTEDEDRVGGNLGYRKGEGEVPLEARIERLFYINLYSQVCLPLYTCIDTHGMIVLAAPSPTPLSFIPLWVANDTAGDIS
jgi:hypothetical protein